MEVVGEALVSSVIDFLFGQLASSNLMQFAREENVHTELKKWEKELLGIRKQLCDAEEKQITDAVVKSWVNDLRGLAYDIEDVLDEFACHWMGRMLMAQADEPSTSKKRKLSKFLDSVRTTFNPTDALRLVNVRPKIQDITARLLDLCDRKSGLGLKEALGAADSAWQRSAPTTPIAYEPGVYGRDEDKKAILDFVGKVGTNENNFGVISIVGTGGVGKTTLARQIFNDVEVAAKFDQKAWACVSDVFDVENITKSILSSLQPPHASGWSDFQNVQRDLRNALKNKKFLLILDDVWNENFVNWDRLRAPLDVGAKGSKVVVTTRHRNVAVMMGGPENFHELAPLSKDDCWSVFAKQAFEHRKLEDQQKLESIGREIAAKCSGLPLAAKVLGGLLRTKQTEDEWKGVLNSKILKLPSEKSEIFPVLHLSYHHLPSYLKRCFAYCAIFPKDYKFNLKTLVLLWMAEGLIEQPKSDYETMEDVGEEYFRELWSRSFFQPLGKEESNFAMHDLIHDLAEVVSSDICFCWEDNLESGQQCRIPMETRHLSFKRKLHLFKNLENSQVLQHLRTFVALPIYHMLKGYKVEAHSVLDNLMSKFQKLRVLSLSGYMMLDLPDSIGRLKHLRYLNFSFAKIESLPDSMTNLCNLQTLVLSHCASLIRLPNEIGNLISLRYLDVFGCLLLENMPQQIGKLKQLQTLYNYKVGKRGFLGLNELKDLLNLKGEIRISGLENVMDVEDARNARLKDKLKIEKLYLIWGKKWDGSYDEDMEEQVLCSLQPHTNLKELRIVGYGGGNFSNWISNPSYSKLVALSLICCVKCKSLPSVGQLPSLKELYIKGIDGVESVGVEFEGRVSGHKKPFQCLESLWFEEMKEWREWSWSSQSFCSLRRLWIRNCPKLVGKVPIHLPSLVELNVWKCPEMMDPLPTDLRSLQKFIVCSCNSKFDYRQEMGGAGGRGSNVKISK